MWLTPERFDDLDFSPDVCVADLRRYVRSLPQSPDQQLSVAAQLRLLIATCAIIAGASAYSQSGVASILAATQE
jgi:hypothetical protein